MKKDDIKRLALLGIVGGIIGAGYQGQAAPTASKCCMQPKLAFTDPFAQLDDSKSSGGNLGYHLLTEKELKLQLNQNGLRLYNSLSKEGKELARRVASRRCNNSNKCEGLNACRTPENECAGKGKCEAKSKCGFSDKNLAVKVAADYIKKRGNVRPQEKKR